MDLDVPYPDQQTQRLGLSTEHNLQDRLGISILCLGVMSLGQLWNHPDLCAPYWRLYLDKRDGARIRQGREWLPLSAGRLYLIPAWLSYASTSTPGVEHIYVHFDLSGPPAQVLREFFPRPIALADLPSRRESLAALGDRIARGEDPGPELVLRARAIVDDCLAETVTTLTPAQRARLTGQAILAGPLGRVLAHIDAAPGRCGDNTALARIAGCSPDHLGRLFRHHLGQSPAHYVTERRLAAAARALAFGDESLEAIAASSGFANRFSFTRAFTRRFGVSPARWRRRGG